MEYLLKQIRSLERHEWHSMFIILIGIISPGILVIWAKNEALLMNSSSFKLVLLAVSITSIPCFINYFLCNIFIIKHEKETHSQKDIIDFTLGVLICGITLYISLVLNYFMNLTNGVFFVCFATLNILLLVFVIWQSNDDYKNH